MGLDVTAYSKLEKVGAAKGAGEYSANFDWHNHVFVYPLQDYPERMPPIEPGAIYQYQTPCFHFRAGSYAAYNKWREWLSLMALGIEPQGVWNNPMAYASKPFFELIHFSDCEGILGTEVCRELAQDFAGFQTQADQHLDEWFRRKYTDWRQAFELASDGGLVKFH